MSEEQPRVKVVDRRRFIQEGENIRENPDARPEEPTQATVSEPENASPSQARAPEREPRSPSGEPSQAQTGTQAAMEAADVQKQGQSTQAEPTQSKAEQGNQQGNRQEASPEEKKQAAERRADQAAAGLPPADVVTLIEFIAQQVSLYLGEPDPMGRSIQPNLPAAGLFIDLLGVLKEKTKGNLNFEEQHALDQVLTALRLRYVQMRS